MEGAYAIMDGKEKIVQFRLVQFTMESHATDKVIHIIILLKSNITKCLYQYHIVIIIGKCYNYTCVCNKNYTGSVCET
jgi:hypothetical protein